MGKKISIYPTFKRKTHLLFIADKVYITNARNEIYSIDLNKGGVFWKYYGNGDGNIFTTCNY